MMVSLAKTCSHWNNKNICLCNSNPSVFIHKHHEQDETPQDPDCIPTCVS
jgi:hypothetical protein